MIAAQWLTPQLVFNGAVSGALLLGALAFQYVGGLAPCALCLDQRYAHGAALVLGAGGLLAGGRVGWVLIALAAIYPAWILLGRWDQDSRTQREAEQRKIEADRRTVEALGGDRFEILHFYASPGILRRGEEAQLCYGVSNAKAVRLDPPDGTVWPSFNRCLRVSPAKDITYTLTIEDAAGQTKNATLTLQVR